jgi:hypothetical protein
MKKLINVVALLALSAPVYADGIQSVDLARDINNTFLPLQSNSNLLQNHGTLTTTMQGSGNAVSSGGNVSMHTPRQAPSVFMSAPMPTAPCQATAGGFLSLFIFGGAGLNGSYTLDECLIKEEARHWVSVGDLTIAKKVLCMAKFSKTLPECKDDAQ